MRVKQFTGMPAINHNSGSRSFRLEDNYPNQLQSSIANGAYSNASYTVEPEAQINRAPRQESKVTDTLLTMRVSIFNTAIVMMKRMLMRIWAFTKSTVFFIWAVFKFMYSALEFMVLFVKFLFTQKHWSN